MNAQHFRASMLMVLMFGLMTLAVPAAVLAQGMSTTVGTPVPPAVAFSAAPAGEADLSPFRFEVEAGGTADATLAVGNEADDAIDLRSYAADVTTATNGGYRVVPLDAAPPEESAWLTVPADPYTVEPGEEVTIPVSIDVPAGTQPGEYLAALATETVESTAIAGSGTFRQVTRKVNVVVITVPGPMKAGFDLGVPSIEEVEGNTTVIVPVENTGNVRVKPQGTITIASEAGDIVGEIPVAMGSVYAWDSTTIAYGFSPALPAGTYIVAIELFDEASGFSVSVPDTEVIVRPGSDNNDATPEA